MVLVVGGFKDLEVFLMWCPFGKGGERGIFQCIYFHCIPKVFGRGSFLHVSKITIHGLGDTDHGLRITNHRSRFTP